MARRAGDIAQLHAHKQVTFQLLSRFQMMDWNLWYHILGTLMNTNQLLFQVKREFGMPIEAAHDEFVWPETGGISDGIHRPTEAYEAKEESSSFLGGGNRGFRWQWVCLRMDYTIPIDGRETEWKYREDDDQPSN